MIRMTTRLARPGAALAVLAFALAGCSGRADDTDILAAKAEAAAIRAENAAKQAEKAAKVQTAPATVQYEDAVEPEPAPEGEEAADGGFEPGETEDNG